MTQHGSDVGLKKNLGVMGCVSFLIQLIIGSGIFIMPNVNILGSNMTLKSRLF